MPKIRDNALKKKLPALKGNPAMNLMIPNVPDEQRLLVKSFQIE